MGKREPCKLAASGIFPQTAQGKQSTYRRKFAQSGHPEGIKVERWRWITKNGFV
jgi:hypothetical protein